jgi:hypothetical protein
MCDTASRAARCAVGLNAYPDLTQNGSLSLKTNSHKVFHVCAVGAPLYVGRVSAGIRHRPGRPWSSSLWIFLPINEELAVPLEGSKARLKSSQHGYRDLGVTTFLKCSGNNVALASDAFPAFDDEAFNLR